MLPSQTSGLQRNLAKQSHGRCSHCEEEGDEVSPAFPLCIQPGQSTQGARMCICIFWNLASVTQDRCWVSPFHPLLRGTAATKLPLESHPEPAWCRPHPPGCCKHLHPLHFNWSVTARCITQVWETLDSYRPETPFFPHCPVFILSFSTSDYFKK